MIFQGAISRLANRKALETDHPAFMRMPRTPLYVFLGNDIDTEGMDYLSKVQECQSKLIDFLQEIVEAYNHQEVVGFIKDNLDRAAPQTGGLCGGPTDYSFEQLIERLEYGIFELRNLVDKHFFLPMTGHDIKKCLGLFSKHAAVMRNIVENNIQALPENFIQPADPTTKEAVIYIEWIGAVRTWVGEIKEKLDAIDKMTEHKKELYHISKPGVGAAVRG